MTDPAIDIDRLDTEERLQLLERVWDSLAANPEAVPLTEAQRLELDRRLDEMERGDEEGIPWEEVLNRIQDRLR